MTTKPLLGETGLTLKALCASCGLPKSGTKPVLVQRLRHAARHFQPVPSSARILSIDMGLKNFAFSLISPAPPSKKKTLSPNDTQLDSPIRLHAWHRLDLTLPTNTTTTTPQTTKKKKKTTKPTTTPSEPPPPNPAPLDPNADPDAEAFSPSTLAALTADLVKTRLLPLRPTHVLIERQRFRTGGAAPIFEWTLRVNSLEAMLHAAFAALRGTAGGGGGGVEWEWDVTSVLPKTVAEFLIPVGEGAGAGAGVGGGKGDGEEVKGKGKGKATAGKAYRTLKRGKVDIMGGLLEGGGMVVAEKGQAKEMVSLFMDGVERRGGGKGKGGRKKKATETEAVERTEVAEVVTKMDDLSDAVLQGMVWLQWRRNLEALIKERPELLEEEKV
ncbi:mitochondrial resolvase Ydc2 [Chaetomium fimeti]|uniref:Mitochondrial resolvase Ydc2 n=1 Tax=Chaetomium fimeti TaxID=1854472 RepID=A0AAE0HJY9_9PEZI|nr:mitochondrial resolvase Ydc2 [Chaetomium fimeti]